MASVRSIMERMEIVQGGCFIWTGYIMQNGYPEIYHDGGKYYVHRLMYELRNGVKLTTKQCICHRCDTPSCIRPDHLFLGTQADNVRDCKAKGRTSRGKDRHNVRLTKEKIPLIREMVKKGWSSKAIGARFGVAYQTIDGIKAGRSWAWVT